eukprot:TRINITY_DN5343_c0_g1_i4.p1 TRINITY_DN5343_c0_g1~~TRINITY_DN5343_c0_g1_i4.p1  ORF type:complete len:492 (+),score=73.32 TRINITY_DN5343_c0_g1_i4:68-1477(+)
MGRLVVGSAWLPLWCVTHSVAAAGSLAATPDTCGSDDGWLRHVRPEQISEEPRVYRYPGLLTDAACDAMIRAAEEIGLAKSSENNADSNRRQSSAAWLTPLQESEGAPRALKRFAALETKMPPQFLERLQVQQYAEDGNQHYRPHFDASGEYGGRRRTASMLFYLGEPEEGGETVFPLVPANSSGRPHSGRVPRTDDDGSGADLSVDAFSRLCRGEMPEGAQPPLRVRARKGDALLFYTLATDGVSVSPYSLHGSCPVLKGTKWVSQQWVREVPLSPHYHPSLVGAWELADGWRDRQTISGEMPHIPPLQKRSDSFCASVDFSDAHTSGSLSLVWWVVVDKCRGSASVTLSLGGGAKLLTVVVRDCQVAVTTPSLTRAGSTAQPIRKRMQRGQPLMIGTGMVPERVADVAGSSTAVAPPKWGVRRWLSVGEGGARDEPGVGFDSPTPDALRAGRVCVRVFGQDAGRSDL